MEILLKPVLPMVGPLATDIKAWTVSSRANILRPKSCQQTDERAYVLSYFYYYYNIIR